VNGKTEKYLSPASQRGLIYHPVNGYNIIIPPDKTKHARLI